MCVQCACHMQRRPQRLVTRMAQYTQHYNDMHLDRLDPILRRPQPAWDVSARVHYYDADSDPAASLPRFPRRPGIPVAGEMISAEADDDIRELSTTIIIDLRAQFFTRPAPANRIGPGMSLAGQTSSAWSLRSAVLQTLLHELWHAHDHWRLGEGYAAAANAGRQRAAEERARRPLGPGEAPEPYPGYRINPFERDAEAFATRKITELKGAIDGGALNDILPPSAR